MKLYTLLLLLVKSKKVPFFPQVYRINKFE